MSTEETAADTPMNIRLPFNKEEVTYCDNLVVSYSPYGFLVDLLQANLLPDDQDDEMNLCGLIVSRLFVPPAALREMIDVLTDTYEQYEKMAQAAETG